jgi:hypothetical protein
MSKFVYDEGGTVSRFYKMYPGEVTKIHNRVAKLIKSEILRLGKRYYYLSKVDRLDIVTNVILITLRNY